MFEAYSVTFWGVWLILTTIFVQAMVALVAHRKQKECIPGIISPTLGHESFVFRSDRTFHNSLENIIPFLGMVFIAFLIAADAVILAYIVWVYAIARILHMALYYKIATEKNPSPRSYFYIIALLSNLILIGFVGYSLI